jgi:acyl-CoA dehydrogenase
MQTFDNTRPLVAAMALGVARASLEVTETSRRKGVDTRTTRPRWTQHAARPSCLRMEAELEAARLLTLKAAWMADNGMPNSVEASMAKAKAGASANAVTLRCVELCGAVATARPSCSRSGRATPRSSTSSKGTQQIQLLIVARRLLGKRSNELR